MALEDTSGIFSIKRKAMEKLGMPRRSVGGEAAGVAKAFNYRDHSG